jgi:hypothetical protein
MGDPMMQVLLRAVGRDRAGRLLLVMPLALATAACSRSETGRFKGNRLKTAPAGGVVTLGGDPVEAATVVLFSVDHNVAATAATDKDGRFRLRTYEPRDGAVVGSHRVVVDKTTEQIYFSADPEGNIPPPKITHHLPEKYRDRMKSGLTVEVTEAGPNEFILALEGQAGKR